MYICVRGIYQNSERWCICVLGVSIFQQHNNCIYSKFLLVTILIKSPSFSWCTLLYSTDYPGILSAGINCLPLSTICLLNFGTISTMWYFWLFTLLRDCELQIPNYYSKHKREILPYEMGIYDVIVQSLNNFRYQ